MKIKRIDHACFVIETQGLRIVTDPFARDIKKALSDNPELCAPDYVLITHAHGDHMGALPAVYGKSTKVVAMVEISGYLANKGFNATGMNMGGTIDLGGVKVSMVTALHSSGIEQDGKNYYGGLAAGYIIKDNAHTVYFAGDTDVFADMDIIRLRYSPDIVILPVGGHYTMDVEGAIFACNQLLKPKVLIPMHYDTFSLIKADLSTLESKLSGARAIILDNGKSWETT